MSSKLKWIGIVVVAVILILFILPFLIPVNKFRPTIEEKATVALGRKVELGNLSLSILGGSLGIDNLSISDDPKFSSGPFLTAKRVKVGVELLPLIFSQKVNVTEITIVNPQVVMLKDRSGKWNFSSIGGSPAPEAKKAGSGATSNQSATSVSIGKLELEDGQITLGSTTSQKKSVYTKVNLTASDVAMDSNFPCASPWNCPVAGR
ncbi:MAG: AsmA family protein [Acidobacteriota bacterium]|nr:AsmA family protein [Acidobacteriota bacterium]